MALLAIGIAAALFVVARFTFASAPAPPTPALSATTIAIGITGVTAGLAVTLWFVLPLIRRLTRDRGSDRWQPCPGNPSSSEY